MALVEKVLAKNTKDCNYDNLYSHRRRESEMYGDGIFFGRKNLMVLPRKQKQKLLPLIR